MKHHLAMKKMTLLLILPRAASFNLITKSMFTFILFHTHSYFLPLPSLSLLSSTLYSLHPKPVFLQIHLRGSRTSQPTYFEGKSNEPHAATEP